MIVQMPPSGVATTESWVTLAANVPAPWQTDRPQRVVMRLAAEGYLRGSVLDVGCGTGENSLFLAHTGLTVSGIDVSEGAIRLARRKANARGIAVDFRVGDVLDPDSVEEPYDCVLDCGLLHSLHTWDHRWYAARLAAITRPGGRCFVLCFGEMAPDYLGAACLSPDDLRAAFSEDWRVERVEAAHFELRHGHVPGWLATIERVTDA